MPVYQIRERAHDLLMVRLPRLVPPGLPYDVTQRGNRHEQAFFEDDDYALHAE